MARLIFTAPGGTQVVQQPELNRQPIAGNPALMRLALARRVLLLQGPVGPFFDRLATWLIRRGAQVYRIAFQAGDLRDCRVLRPIEFKGDLDGWPEHLRQNLSDLGIDTVVLFGQARKHHAAALRVAAQAGIHAVVLEEGYIRPGFVTMELGGVNAASRTLDCFAWDPAAPGFPIRFGTPRTSRWQFWQMAACACRHYWALHWAPAVSTSYSHHRSTDIWQQGAYWARSWLRKHLRWVPDHARVRSLQGSPYFFVPLQHEGDSQITHHSPYPEIASFIREVLESFAAHAPAGSRLVFKTHPHARGGPNYEGLIRRCAVQLGVAGRTLHLIEGRTPTLVEHARGLVLINSTVGLQALMRRKPLAVLGDAIYKRPGLHFDAPLHRFWNEATAPSTQHAGDFLKELIALTQVPCNLYGAGSEPLDWSPDRKAA